MLVRPFAPGDTAAVNAIARAAFAQYAEVYSDWATVERAVGSMASLGDSGEIIVAESEEGRLAGAIAYVGPHSTPRADSSSRNGRSSACWWSTGGAREGIGAAAERGMHRPCRRDGAEFIALHTARRWRWRSLCI